MKYYYGLWNNFYEVSWPARFFMEILFVWLLLTILIKILRKVGIKLHLKEKLIKCLVWIVSEGAYLFGRNKEWAIRIDDKVKDWGNSKISEDRKKGHGLRNFLLVLFVFVFYFAGIFVDLPISKRLEGYYITDLENFKYSLQKIECIFSKGYEEYPPLFLKKETVVSNESTASQEITELLIILNAEGRNGANIRQEPSLDAAIVGGVNGDNELIYQNCWVNDGERYWVEVYCPNEEICGWISGRLIEQKQLEMIVNTKE